MSGASPAPGGDPSMEDILASIRRILNEEDAAKPGEGGPARAAADDEPEVFALDASMLVSEPTAAPPIARHDLPSPLAAIRDHVATRAAEPARSETVLAATDPVPPSPPDSLIAPEAAAAAAQSVGALRRAMEAGRQSVSVRAGGPTLDDIVREELRPVLKAWLDANLPALVERLVRAEIERVVGRLDL